MAIIHLLCLTSTGGLPIFSRKRGDCDSLPFSTVGSLNGVHMFCKSQGVTLKTTYMEDGIIIWRQFENCITFIGAAKGLTESVLNELLNLAFNAMVFCIGLMELKKHNRNVEQLKRDLLKPYYPIVDRLLESADTDLLNFTDSILCSDGIQMLSKLNEFSEQISSPFCAILINQKVFVGTEGWWDLNVVDRKLLIALLGSSSAANNPDIPVYLPHKSPSLAYRFVYIPIWQNVQVCVLCGAEPRYNDLKIMAQHIWKNDLAILEQSELCYPRNFPLNVQFNEGILGIILINKTHSKYIISRNVQSISKRISSTAGAHRLDILRTFFHQAVDSVDAFLQINNPGKENAKSLESYWCLDYHKCHSYAHEDNLICVLYVSSIPTHTMR